MTKGGRIPWSKTEKEILHKTYMEKPYLTGLKLTELIASLGRRASSSKNWFRNERRRRRGSNGNNGDVEPAALFGFYAHPSAWKKNNGKSVYIDTMITLTYITCQVNILKLI